MRHFLSALLLVTMSTSLLAKATLDEALKNWDKRDQKPALEAAISNFEELHKETPKDAKFLVYLTRANFLLADAHSTSKEDKLKYFERAYEHGQKALELNETYKLRVSKKDEPHFAVKAFTKLEVPQIYWTAASLGRFAKTNGVMSSLKYKSTIIALIQKVEELDPTYFHGAVARYWGSYYAVLPKLMGGSLSKSKEYFDQSMKMAPEYVGTKVLRAETYLVEADKEKEFKQVLEEVISDQTYDNHPELGPENRLEKIKAKALLDSQNKLF